MPEIEERLQSESRVKQAVKEALTEQSILGLKASIDEMKRQIAEGFNGVHQRQDTTNGKVLKARDDIIELRSDTKSLKEKVASINRINLTIGTAVGLAIVAAILKLIIK